MTMYDIVNGVRYFSLFDGIGAVHPACQPLGWSCVGVAEIAHFPAAVVQHHYGFRNLRDMTKFRDWPEDFVAGINCVAGGSPCPSYSQAGKRRGLADKQGALLLEFADFFNHVNGVRRKYGLPPAIAIFENVLGLLSSEDNAFGHFVSRLLGCHEPPQTKAKIGKWGKAGLLGSETARVSWRVLNSDGFAVAQRRKRVFAVIVPLELIERYGERACPSRILSLRCSGKTKPLDLKVWGGVTHALWVPKPSESVGGSSTFNMPWLKGVHGSFSLPLKVNLSDVLETGPVDAKHYLTAEKARNLLRRARARGKELTPLYESVLTMIAEGTRGIAAEQAARAAMKDRDRVAWSIDGLNQSGSEEVYHTLRVGRDSGDAVFVAIATTEVAGTLTASRGNGFRSNGLPTHGLAIEGNWAARTMTPLEWERLMGLPDGYTLVPYRKNELAKDSPRYESLGNAIVVPILTWIGQQITKVFTVDPLPGPQEPGEN